MAEILGSNGGSQLSGLTYHLTTLVDAPTRLEIYHFCCCQARQYREAFLYPRAWRPGFTKELVTMLHLWAPAKWLWPYQNVTFGAIVYSVVRRGIWTVYWPDVFL